MKILSFALLLFLIVVAGTMIFKNTLTPHDVKVFFLSFGSLATLIFIIVFTIRTLFVFIPCSIMLILAGNLFGPILGSIVSVISLFFSATFAFFLSRHFGEGFTKKILKNKSKYIDSKLDLYGIRIIFLMRISFVIPFDILSYAAGVTKIKYSNFIIGTFLGTVPEVISLPFLGNNLEHPFSKKFYISILLVVITVVSPSLFNKYRSKKHPETDSPEHMAEIDMEHHFPNTIKDSKRKI
jgi:uncharacterized membrane protein YdjX (TVP38/TMEM64 family)